MGENAVDAHIEYLALLGRSERTRYLRCRMLGQLADAIAPVPLLSATPELILGWRKSLTVAPDSIAQYVGHIKIFYAWCDQSGLLQGADPARWVPVPPMMPRGPRPPADEDVLAAVACAGERIRPWLVLGGWQGLRPVEIARLRRDRVMETHQPPALLIARGATKGMRERVLPLSGYVLAELQAHGLPSRGYLFLRHDHGRGPNSPGLVSKLANEHLREWGFTLHQLRHWYATRMLLLTNNVRMVQDLLGHASPATTAIYTAWVNKSAATAMASFPVPPGR